MINLCWTILGLPLIAAGIITFLIIPAEKASQNKTLFRTASAGISILSIVSAFVLSLILLQSFRGATAHGDAFEVSFNWMTFPAFRIEIGLLLNDLSLLMLLIVTGVASLVAIFSSQYMKGDEGYSRYFAALAFFSFSMLGIVLANNLIQIFIFWELVGVASYLLIGFWFEKPSASLASKKAFLTTRIGDAGMILGILLLFGMLFQSGSGTFNFLEIETRLHQASLPGGLLTLACLGIFLGAVGKSAQVPLHVWLPDAMEGPTPASALIHAATMVAAGVFMLARLFFIFEMSPAALQFIAWTGVVTALLAASMAIVQNDIKKVLAYSTLSQLGYMVMAVGLKSPAAGMFHLTTHAFFKALLFLGAGSLIHALHTQDVWQLRLASGSPSQPSGQKTNLFKTMPITTITFLIGTAALAGLPFTSGFFSKEEILGAASTGPKLLFGMALLVVFLTAFYMGRIITLIFFSSAPSPSSHHTAPHEDNGFITIPLIILAFFSITGGYLHFQSFLENCAHTNHHVDWLAAVSVALAVSGLLLSFILYRSSSSPLSQRLNRNTLLARLATLLKEKYFFDRLYDWLIQHVQEKIALATEVFERIFIVKGGVEGLSQLTHHLGSSFRKLQNGWLQTYGLTFVLGWILLVIYLVFRSGVTA